MPATLRSTGGMATQVLLSSPRTTFLPEPGCRGHANLTQQRWDTVLQRLEQSLAPAGFDIVHPLSVAWCVLSMYVGMQNGTQVSMPGQLLEGSPGRRT